MSTLIYFYSIFFFFDATVRCIVMYLRNQNNSLLSENLLSDMFKSSAFKVFYRVEVGFFANRRSVLL